MITGAHLKAGAICQLKRARRKIIRALPVHQLANLVTTQRKVHLQRGNNKWILEELKLSS